MKIYSKKQIRNIVLIGSSGSGKSALVEAMLLESGTIKRKSTAESYLSSLEYKDTKINILDTPGTIDFIGDIIPAIEMCENIGIVINAQHGIDTNTSIILNKIKEYNKPTFLIINQIDHPKSFNWVEEHYHTITKTFPKLLEINIDSGALMEDIASLDEELMEKFLENNILTQEELQYGIQKAFQNNEIMPLLRVSALNNTNITSFLDNIVNYAISPNNHDSIINNLFIFKTSLEQHIGQLNYFKVISSDLHKDMELINKNTREYIKINQIYVNNGKTRETIESLSEGDIGILIKQDNLQTNHIVTSNENSDYDFTLKFPESKIKLAVVADSKDKDEKMINILKEISKEDPTFTFEFSKELKQLIISAQGEIHIEKYKKRLKEQGINITLNEPKISYRETIQKPYSSMYRHKKQSGGAGQFGEVHLKLFPYSEEKDPDLNEFSIRKKEIFELPWGGKLVFYNAIVGGSIDARYIPSILKGIMEKMEEGPITGSYVRDICVVIYDGKMHPVDSNDISFKIAGSMAFKDAFLNANPLLMEPIYDISIYVPENLVGDVMSDLQSRRSIIMGIDSDGIFQVIKAQIPLSEIGRYSTTLKSITQGQADFSTKFSEYSVVPMEIQKKLASEYEKEN